MTGSFANRAGKGLQKQLMVTDSDYAEKYDAIFRPKKLKPAQSTKDLDEEPASPDFLMERAKKAVDNDPNWS